MIWVFFKWISGDFPGKFEMEKEGKMKKWRNRDFEKGLFLGPEMTI